MVALLGGCDGVRGPDRGEPVVRASDGASASMVIIACPPSETRALAVGELIQMLTQQDELVIARDRSSARLVINACPHAQFLVPPALPAGRRR
jgi:hypothetical protein